MENKLRSYAINPKRVPDKQNKGNEEETIIEEGVAENLPELRVVTCSSFESTKYQVRKMRLNALLDT